MTFKLTSSRRSNTQKQSVQGHGRVVGTEQSGLNRFLSEEIQPPLILAQKQLLFQEALIGNAIVYVLIYNLRGECEQLSTPTRER